MPWWWLSPRRKRKKKPEDEWTAAWASDIAPPVPKKKKIRKIQYLSKRTATTGFQRPNVEEPKPGLPRRGKRRLSKVDVEILPQIGYFPQLRSKPGLYGILYTREPLYSPAEATEGYVRTRTKFFYIRGIKKERPPETALALSRHRPVRKFDEYGYRPYPRGSYAPTPLKPYTPAPVKAYTSVPLKAYTPVPPKKYTPAPLKPYKVVPLKPYRAAPLKAYRPEPLKPYKPVPLKFYTPVPIKSYSPVPLKPYTPIPPKRYKLLGEKRTKGVLIKGGTYSRELCPYCGETIELKTSGVRMLCHKCKNKVRYVAD